MKDKQPRKETAPKAKRQGHRHNRRQEKMDLKDMPDHSNPPEYIYADELYDMKGGDRR